MKTYEHNGNMEFGEQVLRGGVGAIMLGVALFLPAVSSAEIAGLSMAALYMVFTAIMGWEPLYSLGQNIEPHGEPVKATVKPYPARRSTTGHDDYPKAA